MKTKNIFRMLLVAAALLLGANNVKAGVEGQIWPANGADNTTDECSISNEVFINAGVSDGTVLRVYCGPITGGGGYFAIRFYANGQNPEFKAGIEATWETQVVTNNQGLINNSYIDLTCSANTATKLKNGGFSATVNGITIKNVAIVEGSGSDGGDGGGQPTTYTVTVNAGSNGSASVDKQNAASGEKVTITTVPNSGYRVSSVTVTGGVSVSEETANTTYSFTMPANNVTVNVTFELETQGTPDQLVIGNTGYATYSNAENAINLSGLSGVKAYIATAISLEQNKVTLTQVSGVVAANTGLIFISENKQPGTFNLPIASSTGTTYNNNLLLPSYANTTLSPSDAWYTYYVLVQRENNSVKFAEVYSYDAQPGAGKAYLRTSKNQASARTRGISIEINDGTTGINAVENEQGENVIYNLRGQRVENPTKGLYIINGKKVLIK